MPGSSDDQSASARRAGVVESLGTAPRSPAYQTGVENFPTMTQYPHQELHPGLDVRSVASCLLDYGDLILTLRRLESNQD